MPSPARLPRRDLLRALRVRSDRREALSPPGTLLRARRPAMGSHFEVQLSAGIPQALDLAERVLDHVDALEAQMTIYRDDSELSRLNASAHLSAVTVEPRLFALLERAFALGSATGGAYDVASGALSIVWGFVRGPKRVPDPAGLADAMARSGARLVQLDRVAQTVAFKCPGVVLNLGSIGKGYAVDEGAAILRGHWWPTTGLVSAGQSSVYAVGSPPDRFGGRWPIALRNPFDPSQPLGTIWLRNRGLGTSGDTFQRFEADGRRYGHILDPRSGWPLENPPASVTVLAPTAAEADALSTAFSILGLDGARDYCARQPRIGALFVVEEQGRPALYSLNLADGDFEPAPGLNVKSMTSPANDPVRPA